MVSGYLEFKEDEEATHNPLNSTTWENQNCSGDDHSSQKSELGHAGNVEHR